MEFSELLENKVRIASFDIGKKNFAQYVEDADIPVLKKLEEKYFSLPKKLKRRIKGPMNLEIESILDEIYKSSSRVQTGVYDLRYDKSSKNLDMKTRTNLFIHLCSFRKLWETCDFIIIEEQYFKTTKGGKGTEANVSAIKFAEATLAWFMNEYPFKKIMYFGSQNKTQILGAPEKLTKPQRKKWAEEKCRKIYEMRDDTGIVELFKLKDRIFRKRLTTEKAIKLYLDSYPSEGCSQDCIFLSEKLVKEKQKLDDIGDACIQAQAFKFRYMVGNF